MPQQDTKTRILDIARDALAADGLAGLSFDAIARRLGRTKQAVLYWYPTKQDLLAAMYLPWLEAEAHAVSQSLDGAEGRRAAIDAFARTVAQFHFEDLDRFRAMYLLPQTIRTGSPLPDEKRLLSQVHKVTDAMYSALANRLERDPLAARREAFAIHAAVMGLVLMHGLADSLRDPLKHNAPQAVDALIASLCAL